MDSPNQWNEKGWGKSIHLHIGFNTDLAFAKGLAGGASSLHIHHQKHNTFVVDDGVLEIWGHGLTLIAHLEAGQSYAVSAGVEHRMVFLTDARVYEFYHALANGLSLDDIKRIEPGWKPGEREVISRQPANPLPHADSAECGVDSAN